MYSLYVVTVQHTKLSLNYETWSVVSYCSTSASQLSRYNLYATVSEPCLATAFVWSI